MRTMRTLIGCMLVIAAVCLPAAYASSSALERPAAQGELVPVRELDTNPPDETAKLVFVHASIGALWLHPRHGDLATQLQASNYYVSDYHWANHPELPEHNYCSWSVDFGEPGLLNGILNHNAVESGYERTLADPGGKNDIVMIKPCGTQYPIYGSPGEPPSGEHGCPMLPLPDGRWSENTVGNVKQAMLDTLTFTRQHPDKFFVLLSAPPNAQEYMKLGENARAVADWMVHDLLEGYDVGNVMVFDLYNVLTSNLEGEGDPCPADRNASDFGAQSGNHHRVWNGEVQHQVQYDQTYSAYCDNHPYKGGMLKATGELIPLLNAHYNAWRSGAGVPSAQPDPTSTPLPATPTPTRQVDTPAPTAVQPAKIATATMALQVRETATRPSEPAVAQTPTSVPTHVAAGATLTPSSTHVATPALQPPSPDDRAPLARPFIFIWGLGAGVALSIGAFVLLTLYRKR